MIEFLARQTDTGLHNFPVIWGCKTDRQTDRRMDKTRDAAYETAA